MKNKAYFDTLKQILHQLQSPESLDSHPWINSPIVRDVLTTRPELTLLSPGYQLIYAIERVFQQLMPSTPPRRGKRLDTRWGEFGLLAAQYFAPIRFGIPAPSSLRDAWGKIDQVILLYVFGSETLLPSEAERIPYKLVGCEPSVAPDSTLSDWHQNGIQRLADAILSREEYLKQVGLMGKDSGGVPAATVRTQEKSTAANKAIKNFNRNKKVVARFVTIAIFLLLVTAFVFGGIKAQRIYQQATIVKRDLDQAQTLTFSNPNLDQITQAGLVLSTLKQDFGILEKEVEPVLWLTPWLDWVPTYGGDLAAAQDIVILAKSMLIVAEDIYKATYPITKLIYDNPESPDPAELIEKLHSIEPELIGAQETLFVAQDARARLDLALLSPRVRDLIQSKADPLLVLLSDGLTVAIEIPRLMGATNEGPKTYLLLVQNEDELRPTGGFITAAGTLLIQDGEIVHLTFEDSGSLDNWSKPYPAAPWQLTRYMHSPVLIFRDANWFTDFPTAALYAEYLYSFYDGHSVDGVIAFDQQMLVDLLGVLGPIAVEDAPYPIDANNVISYMRSSKTPTNDERASPDWSNKAFINRLTTAILDKFYEVNLPWENLFSVFLNILNEHHVLLQLDDPSLAPFLARRGWNGAVAPDDGDFLMVVDFNVGFNKTNAIVETSIDYQVDLSDVSNPVSKLTVTHKNNSVKISCFQWHGETLSGEQDYPIDRCYWDYMRVYTPLNTKLLQATPQAVPADWTILKQPIPPQVDLLGEEIDGVQAFGTLKVVPGSQFLSTSFDFALPRNILDIDENTGHIRYHLRIQKQPGTLAIPVTIQIIIPLGAVVDVLPPNAAISGNVIALKSDLKVDREFDLIFTVP